MPRYPCPNQEYGLFWAVQSRPAFQGHEPLTRLVLDTARFDRSIFGYFPMPAYPNPPNFKQAQTIIAVQSSAAPELWKDKTIEAVASLKARVAGRITCLNRAKKGLKGFVHIHHDLLRGLRENHLGLWEGGTILLTANDLFVLGDVAPLKFIGQLAFFKAHVMPVTTVRQHLKQAFLLRLGGVQPICVGS